MRIKPGVVISGRYEIIEQIGSGGMSIVYKARDKKLGREVTLKVLRAEYVNDMDFIRRFDSEARSAASLSHPNIVNVYDVGHDGLVNYIVMEYIDGVTLKEIIKRRAPFSNDETLGVAIQIASALKHAHKHNIIHRDIKPQNILVMANGIVKVTDFGIAKASSTKTITIANNTMGSVHYFSPEQAKGGYISCKSDIYSLGLVMFEMATGRLPFDGDTPVAVAIKQINEFLPDMKEFNPQVSDRLQKIVSCATEKFVSRRYENVEKMEDALKRALTSQVQTESNTESDTDFKEEDDDIKLSDSQTIKLTQEDIMKIKKESSKACDDNLDDEEDYYDIEYELNQTKKEKRVVIAAIITSLVLIFLIYFAGYKIFFAHRQVPVPNLVGKELDEAERIAKKLGVKIKQVGTEYNSEIEKDRISNQNYNLNDNLYHGDTIDVKVSLGIRKVSMPNVVNKDLLDAYNMLQSFKIEEIFEYSTSVPNNIVMKQNPKAGELVDENAYVILHISKGKEIKNVTVPNIIGLTESDAKIKLNNSNLIVGSISKSESKKYPEGVVIAQSIASEKVVQAETIISFVVSSGYTEPSPSPSRLPSPSSSPTPSIKKDLDDNNNDKSKNNDQDDKDNNSQEKIIENDKTTPEPSSTPDKTKEETKILLVDPANIPEGSHKVRLKILKITADADPEIFYEAEVDKDKLPLRFSIGKEDAGEYQVYIIDSNGESSYQGSTTIAF